MCYISIQLPKPFSAQSFFCYLGFSRISGLELNLLGRCATSSNNSCDYCWLTQLSCESELLEQNFPTVAKQLMGHSAFTQKWNQQMSVYFYPWWLKG